MKCYQHYRLDLDAWIHEPDLEDEASEPENESVFGNPALRSEFAGFGGPPRFSSDEDRDYEEKLSRTKGSKGEPSEEELQKVYSSLRNSSLKLIPTR